MILQPFGQITRYIKGIGLDVFVFNAKFGAGNVDRITDFTIDDDMHHLLQALCRSAVRQGSASQCGHSNAYIIAPKRSGVRELLPVCFPGCRVSTWKPAKAKAKEKASGKVQQALTYVEMYFEDYPDEVLRFTELRAELGFDAANFRDRIRKHGSFKSKLEALGVREVTVGNYRYRNALAKKPQSFGPVENASYVADV